MSERIRIEHGDCREVIKTLADCSVDSCVTDPPYSLVSIQKRFGKAGSAPPAPGVYRRASSGFMGQAWDTGETAFDPEFWAEVLRVLKPGAHLLAFGGTRTYHRMACAIEDAGFEIRDQVGWVYGSGFPKSHDVSKAIDRRLGADREPDKYGPNGLNQVYGKNMGGGVTLAKGDPVTAAAAAAAGWGTALKPAWEPICLARKPLVGTVAENVMAHGTGALNIDASRIKYMSPEDQAEAAAAALRFHQDQNANRKVYSHFNNGPALLAPYLSNQDKGRWPANVIHDGSPEVERAFAAYGERPSAGIGNESGAVSDRSMFGKRTQGALYDGTGSAARFFYSAKADANDRLGSKHPTVKPVDLIAYLARLVTPKGGLILDPFAGTGTLGAACMREGFRCILIERDAEYVSDIRKRIDQACGANTPLFAA